MIKIKVIYGKQDDKQRLIDTLSTSYKIQRISREYKKEGPYRRIHMDLKNKIDTTNEIGKTRQ